MIIPLVAIILLVIVAFGTLTDESGAPSEGGVIFPIIVPLDATSFSQGEDTGKTTAQ